MQVSDAHNHVQAMKKYKIKIVGMSAPFPQGFNTKLCDKIASHSSMGSKDIVIFMLVFKKDSKC